MGPEDLLFYWRNKCRDGRPPSRADLDPVIEVPALAKHLCLLDIEGDQFRYRLLGSFIAECAGRDSTGKLLDESLIPEPDLSRWLAGLRRVARTQSPLIAITRIPTQATSFTAVALPLVDHNGTTEMILGGLFEEIPRTARRRQPVLHFLHRLDECAVPNVPNVPPTPVV